MTNTELHGASRRNMRKGQARAAATLTVVGGSLVINGRSVEAASFEVTNTVTEPALVVSRRARSYRSPSALRSELQRHGTWPRKCSGSACC